MLEKDLNQLRADIITGKLDSWKEIHKRYDKLWQKYPLDKQKHAFAVLCELTGTDTLSNEQWNDALTKSIVIQNYISDQVYVSRKKDYDNPYRMITFRNREEMTAAIGEVDKNSFIIQVREETEQFAKKITKMVEVI